tara:strand:+ start:1025 stop:1360 length:336 start_codon:yes stop_codon:yes gene_type:complete
MQTKSFSGITTHKELDSTALGYDPGDYAYHYIQVLGTEAETWTVQVRAAGSSVYATIGTLASSAVPISGNMAITPNDIGGFDALKVVFSDVSAIDVTILIASMNRPGLGQR